MKTPRHRHLPLTLSPCAFLYHPFHAMSILMLDSTYDMNILQHLPESSHGLVLVTLNPPFPVDPAKTIGSWSYDHPMMTRQSVSSQRHLPSIQSKRNISFVGAWTKYGFHEDGFASAMRLVTGVPFNVKPPFPVRPAHRAIGDASLLTLFLRIILQVLEESRRIMEPLWVWISWLVVLGLFWIEQGMQVLRWEEGGIEVQRLRECWVGQETKKKR